MSFFPQNIVFACTNSPGGTLLFQAGLWSWLHGGAEMGRKKIYESMMKAASKTYFLTMSSWTYHHVKMKRVLGIEVLQLAQNRENLLLPHFNEDHFMDQHRYLESQERKRRWPFLDFAIHTVIAHVDDWELPSCMIPGGPWHTPHAWWKHLLSPACWVSQCTHAAWTSWHTEIKRKVRLHYSYV